MTAVGPGNVPEHFAATVSRFPDRLAVSVRGEAGVERFTYRELDKMACRAAAFLHSRSVRAGDRCAILAQNDAHWCATYLGILRLGAIAVPLDTAYTPAQVDALLKDSGARLVLTSPRFVDLARDAGARDVALLTDMTSGGDGPKGPSLQLSGSGNGRRDAPSGASPLEATDPAAILYTSGTTADPKGVVLTHGNLLAERDAVLHVLHVDQDDAILGVLPLFHALAQMANLLLPFSLGAHVVFLETLNTRELLRALDEEGITVFCCAPQFFYLIHQRVFGQVRRELVGTLMRVNHAVRAVGLNAGPFLFGRVHRALGRRMRLLITGGSKFDAAIGRDLYDLGFTILQAYGLTETSGAATITRPRDPIETVGRALPGVEIRTLPSRLTASAKVGSLRDPTSQRWLGGPPPGRTAPAVRRSFMRRRKPAPTDEVKPAPTGEDLDGEILIKGPIVMAGYWNRPDATAAVLRDGWLHTGDLGRLDAEARLTITGRSKEVIVLSSGKNIYPEEIEAHYRQSPFIRELCVLGLTTPDEPSAERLHAIVVPDVDVLRERRIVNTTELIRFELEGLSISLPAHTRVLGFDVTMEPLPRTTTGKLKRHEILRRYQTAATAARTEAQAAEEEVEPHVQRVIDAIGQVAKPGIIVRADSNLELDLGLDSMERVELLATLEQRFGVRVPEAVAQQAFFVRELADAFRDAAGAPASSATAPWETLLQQCPLPEDQLNSLVHPKRFVASVLYVIVRALVAIGTRPRVNGLNRLPADGPYIISPNHQSYLDPFILIGVLPYRLFRRLFFVGAAEYFKNPLTRWLAEQLSVVPVDPDANLLPAMQAGAFGLRRGRVLVLFPEGERSIDGCVKKFKKGAAILSRHLGVPIVPVAIDGGFEIWPRNRPVAWRRLLPWSGHHAIVRIGDPLPPAEDYVEHTARLRDVVEQMWLASRTGHEGTRNQPRRHEDTKY